MSVFFICGQVVPCLQPHRSVQEEGGLEEPRGLQQEKGNGRYTKGTVQKKVGPVLHSRDAHGMLESLVLLYLLVGALIDRHLRPFSIARTHILITCQNQYFPSTLRKQGDLPPSPHEALSRPTPTPHTLQQPIPLRQPIQTIIPLAHRPHEAAQRVDLVFARVAPVLIHFADGDLDGGVVFGFDDAVCGGAFAGDVARGGGVSGGYREGEGGMGEEGRKEEEWRKEGWGRGIWKGREAYRSTSSPLSFSMIARVVWVDWWVWGAVVWSCDDSEMSIAEDGFGARGSRLS